MFQMHEKAEAREKERAKKEEREVRVTIGHKLLGDKCMHQYTKDVYIKFSLNFEIEKHHLYNNFKRCSTQVDYMKTISFRF